MGLNINSIVPANEKAKDVAIEGCANKYVAAIGTLTGIRQKQEDELIGE